MTRRGHPQAEDPALELGSGTTEIKADSGTIGAAHDDVGFHETEPPMRLVAGGGVDHVVLHDDFDHLLGKGDGTIGVDGHLTTECCL